MVTKNRHWVSRDSQPRVRLTKDWALQAGFRSGASRTSQARVRDPRVGILRLGLGLWPVEFPRLELSLGPVGLSI